MRTRNLSSIPKRTLSRGRYKYNEPLIGNSFHLTASIDDELTEVTTRLSKLAGRRVSKSAIVRLGLERVMGLTSKDIITMLKAMGEL